MGISLFVLLAWILAVECLSEKMALQKKELTVIARPPASILGERNRDPERGETQVPSCKDEQSHYAVHKVAARSPSSPAEGSP